VQLLRELNQICAINRILVLDGLATAGALLAEVVRQTSRNICPQLATSQQFDARAPLAPRLMRQNCIGASSL
jgi:hypothetical protein